MVERIGKVLKISGDKAMVQFRLTCADDCAFCPVGRLFAGKSRDLCELEAVNRAGAKEGDVVRIEICSGSSLSLYALAYGIPMIGFIAGALAGAAVASRHPRYETVLIAAFSIAGVAAGFLVAIVKGRKISSTPVIQSVVESGTIKASS